MNGCGDDEEGGLGAEEGVDAHGAGPAGEDDAEVAVGELVGGDGVSDGLLGFLQGEGQGQADRGGGLGEPVEVGLEFEDALVVEAEAFEDAVAIEQAVVEDGDGGVGSGVELAVDPDLEVSVGGERVGGGRGGLGLGEGHGGFRSVEVGACDDIHGTRRAGDCRAGC